MTTSRVLRLLIEPVLPSLATALQRPVTTQSHSLAPAPCLPQSLRVALACISIRRQMMLDEQRTSELRRKESELAKFLDESKRLTPEQRVMRPLPQWLRPKILGDITEPLSEDELPEVCR